MPPTILELLQTLIFDKFPYVISDETLFFVLPVAYITCFFEAIIFGENVFRSHSIIRIATKYIWALALEFFGFDDGHLVSIKWSELCRNIRW